MSIHYIESRKNLKAIRKLKTMFRNFSRDKDRKITIQMSRGPRDFRRHLVVF